MFEGSKMSESLAPTLTRIAAALEAYISFVNSFSCLAKTAA